MSRIYEALQKAETERGLEPQRPPIQDDAPGLADYDLPLAAVEGLEPPAARERTPNREGLGGHEPRLSYEAPANYTSGNYTSGTYATERSDVFGSASSAQTLDLRSIPLKPWTPSFRQLPALLERGPGVEQFRSLRSRMYELREVKRLKSVLVSSGSAQEGKSFVAANLAISLARNKTAKVLLIDGDMRRYTLHQLLGCDSEPGLADFLAGRSSLMDILQRPDIEAMKDAFGKANATMPQLTFIAGGNGGDRAADLSNNPRFSELIETVSPLFDWIIVDSSPVLPVSDAVNLARSCDGVLLVARGGVTDYSDAQRAQHELKSSNLLGFVLNAAEMPARSGAYYGYDPQREND